MAGRKNFSLALIKIVSLKFFYLGLLAAILLPSLVRAVYSTLPVPQKKARVLCYHPEALHHYIIAKLFYKGRTQLFK
jgi:hypothetical protein